MATTDAAARDRAICGQFLGLKLALERFNKGCARENRQLQARAGELRAEIRGLLLAAADAGQPTCVRVDTVVDDTLLEEILEGVPAATDILRAMGPIPKYVRLKEVSSPSSITDDVLREALKALDPEAVRAATPEGGDPVPVLIDLFLDAVRELTKRRVAQLKLDNSLERGTVLADIPKAGSRLARLAAELHVLTERARLFRLGRAAEAKAYKEKLAEVEEQAAEVLRRREEHAVSIKSRSEGTYHMELDRSTPRPRITLKLLREDLLPQAVEEALADVFRLRDSEGALYKALEEPETLESLYEALRKGIDARREVKETVSLVPDKDTARRALASAADGGAAGGGGGGESDGEEDLSNVYARGATEATAAAAAAPEESAAAAAAAAPEEGEPRGRKRKRARA